MLYAAGLPRDLLHMIPGDGPTLGPSLIANADYFHFTGSTEVGKLVAQQASERLIGCSLELGGKNPLIILDDADTRAALEEMADKSRTTALIVHIDSPGGSFVGGEQLYYALRKVAENKPVVAVMGTVAASAGYMAAIASDRIFARHGTITGSIGVMMQTTDITVLLAHLGLST